MRGGRSGKEVKFYYVGNSNCLQLEYCTEKVTSRHFRRCFQGEVVKCVLCIQSEYLTLPNTAGTTRPLYCRRFRDLRFDDNFQSRLSIVRFVTTQTTVNNVHNPGYSHRTLSQIGREYNPPGIAPNLPRIKYFYLLLIRQASIQWEHSNVLFRFHQLPDPLLG
eukprot:sb/3472717/